MDAWRKANPDKVAAGIAKWRDANPNKCRELNKKWKQSNVEKVLWNRAKARAEEKNIPFDIELEDIVIPEFCPYLGGAMTRPSLDRIDNSKGYVKGNVQVISHKANTMKNNASIDELVTFAKGVLHLHS